LENSIRVDKFVKITEDKGFFNNEQKEEQENAQKSDSESDSDKDSSDSDDSNDSDDEKEYNRESLKDIFKLVKSTFS